MPDIPKKCLTTGKPVTPEHLEIEENGQQRDYVVLCPEERAKGFIRPLRTTYIHTACGGKTIMGASIAETFARDPKFYTSGTFCSVCLKHFPLKEFVWDKTDELVGS